MLSILNSLTFFKLQVNNIYIIFRNNNNLISLTNFNIACPKNRNVIRLIINSNY